MAIQNLTYSRNIDQIINDEKIALWTTGIEKQTSNHFRAHIPPRRHHLAEACQMLERTTLRTNCWLTSI